MTSHLFLRFTLNRFSESKVEVEYKLCLVHFLKSQAKVQAPVKKKKNSQANILKKK